MKFFSLLRLIPKLFIFYFLSFSSFGSLQESESEKSENLLLLSKIDPNILQRKGDYYYLGKRIYSDPLKIKKAWIYDKETQTRYYYGQEQKVTENNYQQAVRYYKEAARQNHSASLWSLGECYELGRGVQQDTLRWFRLARQIFKKIEI